MYCKDIWSDDERYTSKLHSRIEFISANEFRRSRLRGKLTQLQRIEHRITIFIDEWSGWETVHALHDASATHKLIPTHYTSCSHQFACQHSTLAWYAWSRLWIRRRNYIGCVWRYVFYLLSINHWISLHSRAFIWWALFRQMWKNNEIHIQAMVCMLYTSCSVRILKVDTSHRILTIHNHKAKRTIEW